MVPSNLLLLPLLGGFVFLKNCYYYNVRFQRCEGYRVVLESASWGLVFGIGARLATFLLGLLFSLSGWRVLPGHFATIFPFEFAGTGVLAFLFGPALAWLINRKTDEVSARDLAVDQAGDDLIRLCNDALERNPAVMLTLRNRKVYVGDVLATPNLERDQVYVSILPAMSGYRNQADLRVEFTTNYIKLWNTGECPREGFFTLIPVAAIETSSLFDLDIYEQHFRARALAHSARAR